MPSLVKIGTVNFDQGVDAPSLPRHLAKSLSDVDANSVEVRGNRVTFEAGVFRFVSNWNILVPFGFGDLTVNSDAREVRYSLSYRQFVIFSTVIPAVAVALVTAIFRPRVSLNILGLPLFWLVLASINLAIGFARFESFLSRVVDAAPRRGDKDSGRDTLPPGHATS